MGKYGLGTTRSLADYESYGGFDFKKCRIQQFTLQVKEPPNPTSWENQLFMLKHIINCEWDVSFFKNHNFKNPTMLTLGIQTDSGVEIFRRDFKSDTDPEVLNFNINSYSTIIESADIPAKIVMYLYDREKGWSERFEKAISL